MYRYSCRVPGCTALAAEGHSPLCDRHRRIQYRHGHPLQSAVTVSDLQPHRQRLAAIRKANPDSTAWPALEASWAQLLANADAVITRANSGAVFVRWELDAARRLVTVGEEAAPADVVDTALAMFMLSLSNPGRFPSAQGFDHQLVRRVRGLAYSSSWTHWDHKTQRMKRVYRDMPPRTIQFLAVPLRAAFGRSGLQLATMEQDRAQRLQHAIASLTIA